MVRRIAAWILTIAVGVVANQTASPSVELTCTDTANVSAAIRCDLRNDSGERIFVLTAPLVLDGPLRDDDYLRKLPSGRRYENVLQFGIGTTVDFDKGGLSHPWVDLTTEDLRQLAVVGDERSWGIEIDTASWPANRVSGELVQARVKLVYVLSSNLQRLLTHNGLSETCRNSLDGIMTLDATVPTIKITAVEASAGLRMAQDGCLDQISGQFDHLFSNIVTIKMQRPRQ